jgi:hypothetical protein
MSSGWRCARASPFISLRKIPKSQRLKLVAYWLFLSVAHRFGLRLPPVMMLSTEAK